MAYISNTDADRAEMLAAIGASQFDDLIAPIPEDLRLRRPLNVPPALDEIALVRHLQDLASHNADLQRHISFLGAGIYDHFRPSVVGALVSRGEFATAYTPYQPELSQGLLQSIYEYQTLVCALTGMEVANASMYDGATALAEAALMAIHLTDRPEAVVLGNVHPHYREVLATYMRSTGHRLTEVPFPECAEPGSVLPLSAETACIIMQHPSFLGTLEDVARLTAAAHGAGALSVAAVDPISLGLLKPPSQMGVDIVVGEGQALGSPMSFGGPLLGFFACKSRFVRSLPGRIVGATHDMEGRRGYTMTLRTREQDIRREKATSNICTNEALLALAATVYLCELGKHGLRDVADLCLQKSHYTRDRLLEIDGVRPGPDDRPFFKEFVVRLPANPAAVNRRLLDCGIVGGLPLGEYYSDLEDGVLVCVTETKSRADIERFVAGMACAIQAERGSGAAR